MSGESTGSWFGSDSKVWAVMVATAAAVILSCGLIVTSGSRAAADPNCTASGLAAALATVASATASWLSSHPDAEAAVNTADENTIRTYFAAHTDQWQQLQSIGNPLRTLRHSCPQQVSSTDVARLFDSMSA
jgi:hemophore-related protein